MINWLNWLLLYAAPKPVISCEQQAEFDALLEAMRQSSDSLISYKLPYPKWQFIYYLSLQDSWVFHGSNHKEIDIFEPREQIQYNNERVRAVFASTDSIWPFFYAVFRRKMLVGSTRNGCIVQGNRSYHYYSLNRSTMENKPWKEGMLYILPNDTFSRSGEGGVQFNEWISREPVKSMWRIAVTPHDFYFYRKVAVHADNESFARTWLLYKLRTLGR